MLAQADVLHALLAVAWTWVLDHPFNVAFGMLAVGLMMAMADPYDEDDGIGLLVDAVLILTCVCIAVAI